MAGLIAFIVTIVIALGIGGAGFAYLFYFSRKKKIIFHARCYHVTDAKKLPKYDKHGKIISKIDLHEMKPYTMDILEIIDKAHGVTIYKLRRLGYTTNEVKAEHIETWGKEQYVDVLVSGKTASLIDKGYDVNTGEKIYTPMPREDIDLITSELLTRKDRHKKEEKSVLQAITPWIIMGIVALMTVGLANVIGSAWLDVAEINKESNKMQSDANKKISENMKSAMEILAGYTMDQRNQGKIPQKTENLNKESTKEDSEPQSQERTYIQ